MLHASHPSPGGLPGEGQARRSLEQPVCPWPAHKQEREVSACECLRNSMAMKCRKLERGAAIQPAPPGCSLRDWQQQRHDGQAFLLDEAKRKELRTSQPFLSSPVSHRGLKCRIQVHTRCRWRLSVASVIIRLRRRNHKTPHQQENGFA